MLDGGEHDTRWAVLLHSPKERVSKDHPLRRVRRFVRDVLEELSAVFARLYVSEGRSSVPSEHLRSVLVLHVFYGIQSERQLV